MPSETERAWVAGFMDGDGCITLASASGPTYRKPLVVVDNTDMELLDELTRMYGGSIVLKKKSQEHHRQAWSWRIYGADNVIRFLQDVLPYMRCPSKVIRGRMLVEEYKKVTVRNGYYTDNLRELKEDFEARFLSVGAGRGSQCKPD